MPAGQYPFIDIAVHDRIRGRLAAGEALALFSEDFSSVLWANGGGARLFGFSTIYEFMDEGAVTEPTTLRQMKAAAGRALASDQERPLLLRLGGGVRTAPVSARLSALVLAGGEHGLLLSASDGEPAEAPSERAKHIIDGFAGTDTLVSVVDGDGAVRAASVGMAARAVDAEVRRSLAAAVAPGRERRAQRLLGESGPGRRTAVAIGRLADAPAMHLLFAVETETEAVSPAPAASTASPTAEEEETAASLPATVAGPPDSAKEEPGAASDVPAASPAVGPEPAAASEPTAGPLEDGAPQPSAGPAFVFDPTARPVRFVWKMDSGDRFSEISEDFAQTVGPNAADVIGRTFEEVARVFALDPGGIIADLLRRRDTWSGKTVLWPIQGTRLRVPVDLAALPTYTRERAFDGFRGFGVIRAGEAVADGEAIGEALVAAAHAAPPERGSPEPEPIAPAAADEAAEPGMADVTDAAADPFQGEVPALKIVPDEEDDASDKVVRLERHRQRGREGLSNGEQAAFREIGKRLSSVFGRRASDETEPSAADSADTAAPEAPSSAPRSEPTQTAAPEAVTNETDRPRRDNGDEPPAPTASERPLPSAFAQPAARRATLDEALADALPVALLVHTADRLIHANPDFLTLTGYGSLAALGEAGGLSALFAAPDASDADAATVLPGTMALIMADGRERQVHARLQSIGWRDGRALMLSLAPAQPVA
ncbi:MAG: PAS domain-containing protein, partial [Pararhizobium sp.]